MATTLASVTYPRATTRKPYLSRKSIEVIAKRITSAYKRLLSLQGQNHDMIQPELLVHDLLGLSIAYHTLSRNGKILGLTACGEADVQIYDDPRHPEFFHLDGRKLLIERDLVKEGSNKDRTCPTAPNSLLHRSPGRERGLLG